MDIQEIHSLFLKCKEVSIDTRKIDPDSMFFAIKGANFDANTFANEALNMGARYAVIDDSSYYIDERTILVENSLECLQELAKFHRAYLKLPIIALTGSNGKTTTKELIHTVLSKKYNTKATVGNLNNHIGVPLTLLSFNSETEIGIVEMGANHKKEIQFLCELAQPDYGYITNFGKAHLEGFGGIEGVIQGKSEMYEYIKAENKKAFINLDDKIQLNWKSLLNLFSFSEKNNSTDVYITSVQANPFVELSFSNTTIKSHLIGLYNATNLIAALTIGTYFGVQEQDIKLALESYIPENNRSQLIFKGTNEIILDAYNANPSSMHAAITNFLQLQKQNKKLILGDMFELGSESSQEHFELVQSLLNENSVCCFFIGELFYKHKTERNNFYFYKSMNDFAAFFKEETLSNSILLIKGSRGMKLERVLDFLS